MKDKFILLNGYVYIDNERLYIEESSIKKDIKSRGGWLGVFLALVGLSLFRTLRKDDFLKDVSEYIDFTLQAIGFVTIILIFLYIIFWKKSNKNLIINDLKRIDIDKGEFETELTLVFNNRREKDLEFRTHENQVEPFIENLKKRNTRLEIKHI